MADDGGELNSIAAQLELSQAKGDAIRQQMQAMQASVVEISSAAEAVRNLKKASKDVLVPVGAGTYISCPKPDSEKVLISIGANVLLTKKPEEALRLLEERQKTIGNAINAAQQDLEAVIREIDSLSQAASRLAAEARNVRPSEG